MIESPFQPVGGGTLAIANSVTATTPTLLPDGCSQVALYNTSATAVAFWRCQGILDQGDAGVAAQVPTAGPAPVGGMPIPPGQLIRLSVGAGFKKFSIIATAADGVVHVTPGNGD